MKVSGVQWWIFALIMIAAVAGGFILGDLYLEQRAKKAINE
ncbi:hypothetical protein [Flavilitoribacter nigricans]|nr:hypothetical protein [Flavilitoribacter nigricans]